MIDYSDAENIHKENYFKGRNKNNKRKTYKFPYSKPYNRQQFVPVVIPINRINATIYYEHITTDYLEKMLAGIEFDPIWVTYGKILKDGTAIPLYDHKFQIKDGNHRVEAHRRAGKTTIEAFIPKIQYNLFKNNI